MPDLDAAAILDMFGGPRAASSVFLGVAGPPAQGTEEIPMSALRQHFREWRTRRWEKRYLASADRFDIFGIL